MKLSTLLVAKAFWEGFEGSWSKIEADTREIARFDCFSHMVSQFQDALFYSRTAFGLGSINILPKVHADSPEIAPWGDMTP